MALRDATNRHQIQGPKQAKAFLENADGDTWNKIVSPLQKRGASKPANFNAYLQTLSVKEKDRTRNDEHAGWDRFG